MTRTMQKVFEEAGAEEDYSSVYTTIYSNVYHKSNCPELGTEDIINFDSSQQTDEAGGIPCKSCKS